MNQKLIDWADVIFVMERKHKELLNQRFLSSIKHKQVVVFEIRDKYRFNDSKLIEILKAALADYL